MNGNGYYSVGAEQFTNRFYAMIKATETNSELYWHYYDEVFDKVDPGKTHNLPLRELYKQRAQQLREKYDYLILNYSGGSDSWNILHTFLANNIKLDCIFTHHPFKFEGMYTPNTIDRSNYNHYSEWDIVAKKDLEWISKNHPSIRIETGDWTDNLSDSWINDDVFSSTLGAMPTVTRSLKAKCFCKAERELVGAGKTVGSIYGVDKPYVVEKDNKCFYYFMDRSFMALSNPENPDGVEYFYMTPDFPELAAAQSYRVFSWFSANPEFRYVLRPGKRFLPRDQFHKECNQYMDIVKSIIYPDWDGSRFQTEKQWNEPSPQLYGVRPLDTVHLVVPEILSSCAAWKYYWKDYASRIDSKFLLGPDDAGYIGSRWYYLGAFQ